jgi:RNA polymerase sporulation-specific sigma factor
MDDKLCVDNFKKVVEDNMGLVGSISKKYSRYSRFSYDDIFQVGCIGLMKAAHNFDVHKGYKFSTYAYIKIRGEILLFLKKRTKFHIGNVYPLSLDYVQDSSPGSGVDRWADFSQVVPGNFELEEYISMKVDLEKAINQLPEIYKKIFALKMEGFKYREIAQITGISEISVWRYYKNARRKIRVYMLNYIYCE